MDNIELVDLTNVIQAIFIVAFVLLLGMALALLFLNLICDNHTCKIYTDAKEAGPPGSKEYTESLLNDLFSDGIWPYPYIAATILTAISLWFLRIPITVLNFWVIFLISFITIYFIFVFFGHHYLRPITLSLTQYVENSTPINNPSSISPDLNASIDSITLNDEVKNSDNQ